jgi:type IV pilus assembly protein PilC
MVAKTFAYEALDSAGVVQKGTIEADSKNAVANALSSQSMITLQVDEAGTGLKKDLSIPGIGGRTSLKDIAILSRQFASMTSSGLSLIRALGILEDQTTKPKLKAALGQTLLDVQGGMTLSTAMAQHPQHFPQLMINMIKSGEAGGFLDGALTRVAKMYESDANLRAKIKGAMTYPVIVMAFSLLMGAGVIIFIVPIFEHMFANLGGKLPLPTQIMVDLSHNLWWAGPIVIVAIMASVRAYRKAYISSDAFKLKADRMKLRLPVFGSLFAKIAISRWARNLGTLLSVGVPIIQALDIVGGASGNAVITEAMGELKGAVRVGSQMSTPLSKIAIFPPMVAQMVEVGEETGQLTEMLDKVADYYDHEVETATDALASSMEPLLVVLMGVMIGTMVICLYLPMFTIYQHIQS